MLLTPLVLWKMSGHHSIYLFVYLFMNEQIILFIYFILFFIVLSLLG